MYFTKPNQAFKTGILNVQAQIAPRYQTPLEWWYFHGTIQPSNSQKVHFMLSLFRNQFPAGENTNKEGYQLVLSITGKSPVQQWKQTRIDPIFFHGMVENYKKSRQTNIDEISTELFFTMVNQEGPPQPIILEDNSPKIRNQPFHLLWNSLEIEFNQSFIQLRFNDPDNDLHLSFHGMMDWQLHDLFATDQTKDARHGMSYLTQTRLPIQGELNKQSFQGTAWFDHQWGGYDWLIDPADRSRILGWNWLGINLDNGDDLVIWQQIVSETKEVLDSFAILITDNKSESTRKVSIQPLEEWFSHSTETNYPIRMRIDIPELDLHLIFNPYIKNQEIPVFGPMRSVWQGAGEVSGSYKEEQVSGQARCELSGYAYIHSLKDHLSKFSNRIDQSIASFFPEILDHSILSEYIGDPYWNHEPFAVEEMISKPVWDLMKRSGKRWRPIFAYFLLKALQTDPRPFEQALFALAELIHTGSLIIDDIQDGSLTRRGAESIHLRYGQDLAITAGNTLYFLPSLLIMDHPVLTRKQKHEIMELMNRSLIKAHFGQSMDLFWSKRFLTNGVNPYEDKDFLDRIKQMYALKTGAPLQGLAEATTVISKTSKETRQCCSDFARDLGIAFQIIDDIHNFSESDQWGKTTGEDLKEGKLTFVIASCIRQVDITERKFLLDFIKNPANRNDSAKLASSIRIVRNSGVFDHCRDSAINMVNESWNRLNTHLPPTDSKMILRGLTNQLINKPVL